MKILEKMAGLLIGEKVDWLDKQSYFGKYFCFKIRRLLMNAIYNIWSKTQLHLLEKYYAEFGFYNAERTFEAIMPIIIIARNYIEARDVVAAITKDLSGTYKLEVFQNYLLQRIATDEVLESKKQEIVSRFTDEQLGTIRFETLVGHNIQPNIMQFLPESMQSDKIGKFDKVDQLLNFQVVTDTKHHLHQHSEFFVQVRLNPQFVPKSYTDDQIRILATHGHNKVKNTLKKGDIIALNDAFLNEVLTVLQNAGIEYELNSILTGHDHYNTVIIK